MYFCFYILKISIFIKIYNILILNKISYIAMEKFINMYKMYKIKLYDSYIFEKFIKLIHTY